MIWYKENSPDTVISTRVRLARNLCGIPFPNALTNPSAAIEKIRAAVFNSNSTLASDFEDISLSRMSAGDRQCLAESHLISSQMLSSGEHECFINKDKTMSLMLMEEDHIREQVILGGYKLDDAYELCNKVDDVLGENLNFAFDEKIGYLTACPTNIGTGLRASVMMHLPALSLTGSMNRIIASARNVGITVRGYYGEGSEAEGFFYQISNQLTTGIAEKEIISRVKNAVDQIIVFEKEAREALLKDRRSIIEDRVYRSYGILKYSRSIASKEAISLLSDVLFGKNLGIITEDCKLPIMEIIALSGPAHMAKGGLSAQARDIKRSEYIRSNI